MSKMEECTQKQLAYRKYCRDIKDNKAILREELYVLKHDANKELKNNYRTWFRMLDILGIILILLNFGALFMTGVLVIKAQPTHTFSEANPVQCAWNGWSCHTNWKDVFIPFLKQAFLWGIIIGAYIYSRNNTYSLTGLWFLTIMVLFITAILGWDFINDLGLYVGKIIFAQVIP